MALNKYMHPRNIYKTPPDFGKLSKQYSEFSVVSKVDVTGKVTIDFKDPHSLRILTKSLLKSDFNLDVDIPVDRLVPTLPLRLNYILWVEDLLSAVQRNDNVWGLDIGTGACAIYPLLAAVKNKWKMVGTETDSESFIKAEENVCKNGLQEFIKLKRNTTKSVITHVFTNDGKKNFDFCMCNPPFYSTLQELCESRSPARVAPKNGFTGSPQELITEGGELEFCRKLISESKEHRDDILLFTTMVGHKYNLNVLIQYLKSDGIKYTHTEFCQGRVTRWGLAWTYKQFELYNLVPPRDQPRKKHTPAIYHLPELKNCTYNTEAALNKIKEILKRLDITNKILDKRGNNVSIDIIARSNTWSNQRRKRRLIKRIETVTKIPKLELEKDESVVNLTNTSEVQSSETIHHTPDASNSPNLSEGGSQTSPHKEKSNENRQGEQLEESSHNFTVQPLVHAFLKLLKKGNDILLEIEYLDGSAGKEGLHQIVQYIKNNWK